MEGFVASEEARVTNEMLDAYERGEQEKLDQVTSKQIFTFLEHEVTRVAKGLKAMGGGADDDGGLL